MAPNLFPNLRHRGIKGLDYGVGLETKLESFARRGAILFGMFATIWRRSGLNCPAVKRMFCFVTWQIPFRVDVYLASNKNVELRKLCICIQDTVRMHHKEFKDFLQQAVSTDDLPFNAQGHKLIQLIESIIQFIAVNTTTTTTFQHWNNYRTGIL